MDRLADDGLGSCEDASRPEQEALKSPFGAQARSARLIPDLEGLAGVDAIAAQSVQFA
jgi:hypothetical protein